MTTLSSRGTLDFNISTNFNFIPQGVKKVDFYFSPPLFKEVGYEVVSAFPLAKDQVVLRLRHGYKWREEPGPLSVIGIDTGGGPVKLNGEVRFIDYILNLILPKNWKIILANEYFEVLNMKRN
jgi:hypothetical protein